MKTLDRSVPVISRRAALAGLGATALSLSTLDAARAAEGRLVMANGGGKLGDAYKIAFYDPWSKISSMEVVATGNNPAQLKAMVEQKNMQWDLAQGPAEGFAVYAEQGLFEPIDYSVIDKSKLVAGVAREFFIMTDFAAYHIAWNTKNLKSKPPKNWAELFAVSGRIGLWKRPFQTLEVALLADGVAPSKLYPLDLDRAFSVLTKIKSKLLLWDTGAQGAQVLIDGEIDAGAIWNGRVQGPKDQGASVDFHFNEALLLSDAWAIPKGSPNKKKAMELLAHSLTASAQAAFSRAIPYGPVNLGALALLDDKTKAMLPKLGGSTTMLNVDYWAKNLPEAQARFDKWLLS